MRILILANFGMGLYNFRKELLEELLKKNNEVYISLPNDAYVPKLIELGCKFIDTQMERRGTNPLSDLKLIFHYIKVIRNVKPDVVLTYTIKPNVYGGIACAFTKTAYVTNVTGLGTSVENKGLLRKITMMLYRLGLRRASCVFFQNTANQSFFENHGLVNGKTRLIPGSGVNLEKHRFEEYPESDEKVKFLFIGRIMKAKGIEELLDAAEFIKKKRLNVEFQVIGGMEEDYIREIQDLEKQGILEYKGQQEDVHSYIKESHAIVLPSYHEGLSNVLLESAATGRPILASRVPGCIETFEEGLTGFGFEARNVESLIEAIIRFIDLPLERKKAMGCAGRKKVEKEFDRKFVIKAYIEEIKTAIQKENRK